MNRRQYRKCLEHDFHVDAIKYCLNYDGACEEDCDGCKYVVIRQFKKQLKKEGIPVAGWALFECPASGVYIFAWKKKNKEVTYFPNDSETEQFGVFNPEMADYAYVPTIRIALDHPYQERYRCYGLDDECKRQNKRLKYLWSVSSRSGQASYRAYRKYGGKRI